MYVDFMLFAVIALATGVIVLLCILSSNMKYQEKGFVQLIMFAICHNIIDIFWQEEFFRNMKKATELYFHRKGKNRKTGVLCSGYPKLLET